MDEGCCNMIGENMKESCSISSLIPSSSTTKPSVNLKSTANTLTLQNVTGPELVLPSSSFENLKLSSKCKKIDDCCEEDLCGRKYIEQKVFNNIFILPSICTGTWSSLYFSKFNSETSNSENSENLKKKKSIFMAKNENKTKLSSTSVTIEDMCCAMEANIARKTLEVQIGVTAISISVPLKRLTLKHDAEKLTPNTVLELLRGQGLTPILYKTNASLKVDENIEINSKTTELVEETSTKGVKLDTKVLLALGFLILSLLQYVKNMERFEYLGILSVLLCLPSVLKKSFSRLRQGNLDITTLMSLASIGAIVLGSYSEGAAVITLYSFSGWLEALATERIRNAVEDLVKLKPKTARKLENNVIKIVQTDDLKIDDTIQVRVGDIIASDGIVLSGFTFVDESSLTGESKPVKKQQNSSVFAGTINLGSEVIHIKVTTESKDSIVSKMLELVEEATSKQSSVEQFVEKVARIYTPTIFVLSLLMLIIPWFWGVEVGEKYAIYALVLLVIGCPCALVISTPVTYISGLTQAARNGILIKGGIHLETLASLEILCFDKTGTLTKGNFNLLHHQINHTRLGQQVLQNCSCNVTTVFPEELNGLMLLNTTNDVYKVVSLIEKVSSHPIAVTLIREIDSLLQKEASSLTEPITGEVQIFKKKFKISPLKTKEVKTVKGKGISALVYRVYTSTDYAEWLKSVKDDMKDIVECSDMCCVKKNKNNVKENEINWIDFKDDKEQELRGFKISYKIQILDDDYTSEDISIVLKNLKKKLEDNRIIMFQSKTKNYVILESNFFIKLKLVKQTFSVLGIDIEIAKVKVEEEFFIGSQRLSKEQKWDNMVGCPVHKDTEFFDEIRKHKEDGSTLCIFGNKDYAIASFFVGDEVREEAKYVIDELRKRKIDFHVLTGDNKQATKLICEQIGINKHDSELLPQDKQRLLIEMQEEYEEVEHSNEELPLLRKKRKLKRKRVCGMVGDGINDALCLATADVSMSLGQSGTSLAIETADVTLIEDNLLKIIQAIDIGRLSLSKIRQNIIFSVLIKVVVVAITFGVPFPSLWLAILSDVGAMLAVTLNSISIISMTKK